ncbi:hypothetical protein BDP67DRAFT_163708 [Colletotrichum lupini]|nr:hypothetical protein BDP67DRAFT_163708 [Colletotrichum lupini]
MVNFDSERQSDNETSRKVISRFARAWRKPPPIEQTPAPISLHSVQSHPANSSQARALQSLIGTPAAHLVHWPGLSIYFNHLESNFLVLFDPCFNILWLLLDYDIPATAVGAWNWCLAVIDAYDSFGDQDPNIETIYRRILQTAQGQLNRKTNAPTPSEDEKSYVFQAIFAVLCWTSGTLEPLIGGKAQHVPRTSLDQNSYDEDTVTPGTAAYPSLLAQSCTKIYSSNELRRPTSKMFYAYQSRADDIDAFNMNPDGFTDSPHTPRPIMEDMLYEPSLNFAALSIIGRVSIMWVDTISAHLYFDRASRQLSLYRFPSLCASKILSKQKASVLSSITTSVLPSQYGASSPREPDSVHRELLLSYRLLFGQSRKARKLIKSVLEHVSKQPYNKYHVQQDPENSRKEQKCDPLLGILCTAPLITGPTFLGFHLGRRKDPRFQGCIFPSSVVDINSELMESDTYSAQDDFPTFGPRLLALQRYNMRRQPSKVTDLWRDRRNPLQWYTFWVVSLVGGASILLAILQFIVGLVQMAYAIKPAS